MSAVESLVMPASLQVDYVEAAPAELLAGDDTLAVIGFGSDAPSHDDPRYLRVALQPHGPAPLELWRGHGPVSRGRDGDIAWAEDGALQFGAIELDEGEGDIEATAASIYAQLIAFTRSRGYPHVLRIWNYLDGITHGDGDAERYRVFCVGRARGLGEFDPHALPAATAIGRSDDARRLQVYWLAARTPGTPLENPRQISAYRYPRQYGPQPPSFARAMLPASHAMPLLISGTAAVVGHESRHVDERRRTARRNPDQPRQPACHRARATPGSAAAHGCGHHAEGVRARTRRDRPQWNNCCARAWIPPSASSSCMPRSAAASCAWRSTAPTPVSRKESHAWV